MKTVLGSYKCFFPSGFRHLTIIILNFVTLIVFGEDCKSLSFSLCSFHSGYHLMNLRLFSKFIRCFHRYRKKCINNNSNSLLFYNDDYDDDSINFFIINVLSQHIIIIIIITFHSLKEICTIFCINLRFNIHSFQRRN
jgi:hypothetical protein